MQQKRNLLTLIIFLTVTFSFSQKKLVEFENDLKTSATFIKDVIPIINSENNDLVIFISDAKKIYGYKLNEKFEVIDKIVSLEKRRKYRTLLGYNIIDENTYNVILTDKKETKFLSVNFSFSNKEVTTKEFEIGKKEKIIQTFSTNNNFYLITAKRFNGYYYDARGKAIEESKIPYNDDILNFYIFDNKDSYTKKEANFSDLKLYNKDNDRVLLRSLLLSSFGGNSLASKIDQNTSNPIDITADKSKIYLKENTLLFSFDENHDTTQVLTFNLDDFSKSLTSFDKKNIDANKSNSFIYDDKIFIASANKDNLVMQAIDYNSKDVIKEFDISIDKEIEFKNTPIIQKGGAYKNYRELKSTKQFLRKITSDKFGLSARKINDQYHLTIGGYVIKQSGGGGMMMPGFGGIPIGGIGGVSIFFNPTMFAYSASTNSKSTQIECLFDEDFNHIKGDLPKNAFKKIEKNKSSFDKGVTIFKYKDYFIKGKYFATTKQYKLFKYTDD